MAKEKTETKKEFAPDKVREIGTFDLSGSTEFRVVINTFKKEKKTNHYLDLRQWWSKKGDKEKFPGKGVSVDLSHIDELIKLLKKAKARAVKVGLLNEE